MGFRWDFQFISQYMKINKTRPKFHFFFLQKIEIFMLVSSFSTHIIAKLHFLLIGSTPLSWLLAQMSRDSLDYRELKLKLELHVMNFS